MSRLRASTAARSTLDGGLDTTPVTLVGHPFAPIGMGEQLRSHLVACRAVKVEAKVLDVFRYARRSDPAHRAAIDAVECTALPGGIRIFHINGDEIEPVLAALEASGADLALGYNIIVPAWELPRYPKPWAKLLHRFDEVWALSHFIQGALAASGVESHLVGQSVQSPPEAMLPRRYFGLSESATVLLTMFDVSSHARRKNPEAVLDLFDRLCGQNPLLDLQLVLKVKDGEQPAGEWATRVAANPRVRTITEPLDTHGVRSLLNACDVFVSLHRSEGFGRGLGEAMALGRLAMGTGWSGNLDFMTARNSLLVQHRLVPLQPGDYPHARGQRWAEPDIDHALRLLGQVLADPEHARALARRGRADVLLGHGDRAVGLRMLDRLEQIATATALLTLPAAVQAA